MRPHAISHFKAHKTLNQNVCTMRLFPGITEATICAFLSFPIKGAVLESFGVGNSPSNRPEILKLFSDAIKRGVIIVNITQCRKGAVSDMYETGKVLKDIGVIAGHDMTVEAALAKLSYLLGKGFSDKEITLLMTKSIRGELTEYSLRPRFSGYMKADGFLVTKAIDKFIYPLLLCSAASSGDLEGIKELEANGANVNCYDYEGHTPLHLATMNGHLGVIDYLIRVGSNVHAKDSQGKSPVLYYLHHNSQSCGRLS